MAKAKKLPSGSWRVNLYTGTNDAEKRSQFAWLIVSCTRDVYARFCIANHSTAKAAKNKGLANTRGNTRSNSRNRGRTSCADGPVARNAAVRIDSRTLQQMEQSRFLMFGLLLRVSITIRTRQRRSSTRQIKAPDEIVQKIKSIPHDAESDYIFNFYRGGIYTRFKRIIRNAGIKDMAFHDLRHLNASIMLGTWRLVVKQHFEISLSAYIHGRTAYS